METARIYRLDNLPPSLIARLREGQMEAARVWNLCRDLHMEARKTGGRWPGQNDLHRATKGQFALHSQTIQAVWRAFLGSIEATRQRKRENPAIRYPYKEKRYYPLRWPAQAVSVQGNRLVLPMGRGRRSLVLRMDLPEAIGACQIVWNDGYELHVCLPIAQAPSPPGTAHAAVDLGEVNQAAVTTDTGAALVISGRGIRSLKRRRNKAMSTIARKRSRCKKGSRRWRKLQRARARMTARVERQVRDQRHKGTRKVVEFCAQQRVGTLYIGNPDGIRRRLSGRHHNQRLSQWEYGRDIAYLTYKCQQRRIMCFTGTERGTSSRCPACGHQQRSKGRRWKCRACSFHGHRDVVGSVNMHSIAYGAKIEFPLRITYRRPGPVQGHGVK